MGTAGTVSTQEKETEGSEGQPVLQNEFEANLGYKRSHLNHHKDKQKNLSKNTPGRLGVSKALAM